MADMFLQGGAIQNTGIENFEGANNLNNGQVYITGTATLVVPVNASRRSVTIKNQSPSVTIYVGKTGVTTTTGIELKAGESISIDFVGAIYAISESGLPVIGFIESYD